MIAFQPYAVALALTLATELPVYLLLLGAHPGLPIAASLKLGVAINLLTHPMMWFVLDPLLVPSVGYPAYLVVAELFAWAVESWLCWWWLRREALWLTSVALLANGASYAVGWLLLR